MQKFGSLMNQQRSLQDKTFASARAGAIPRMAARKEACNSSSRTWKSSCRRSLKGMDGKSAQQLREGGKAMGEPQGALSRRDLDNAGSGQNQALEALRQGAQELAQQAQNGQGQNGREDPLGRSGSALGDSG